MANAGLEVFDTTLQQTHGWLKQVMAQLGDEDRHRAYLALRSTLHALRDRLAPEQAVHLGAQLPMLVRGFYYEGWRMAVTPLKERTEAEFLAHIGAAMRAETEAGTRGIAQAVFAVMARQLDPGEVGKVIGALPEDVRALWPAHMVEAAMARVAGER